MVKIYLDAWYNRGLGIILLIFDKNYHATNSGPGLAYLQSVAFVYKSYNTEIDAENYFL